MQRPNLYINAIISHKAFALTEGILHHYRYKMITSPRYFHIFAIQIPLLGGSEATNGKNGQFSSSIKTNTQPLATELSRFISITSR